MRFLKCKKGDKSRSKCFLAYLKFMTTAHIASFEGPGRICTNHHRGEFGVVPDGNCCQLSMQWQSSHGMLSCTKDFACKDNTFHCPRGVFGKCRLSQSSSVHTNCETLLHSWGRVSPL